MISVEAWRASIGSFYSHAARGIAAKVNVPKSCYLSMLQSLSFTTMSLALIATLLLMGGVESNPGPITPGSKGMMLSNKN